MSPPRIYVDICFQWQHYKLVWHEKMMYLALGPRPAYVSSLPLYLDSFKMTCNRGWTKLHPPALRCSSCAQTTDSKLGYDSIFSLTLTQGNGWNCSTRVIATSKLDKLDQKEYRQYFDSHVPDGA